MKKSKEIPKSVLSIFEDIDTDFSLVLFLDGKAYLEFYEPTKVKFDKRLKQWNKDIYPELERSDYRIFIKNKTDINESR